VRSSEIPVDDYIKPMSNIFPFCPLFHMISFLNIFLFGVLTVGYRIVGLFGWYLDGMGLWVGMGDF